MDWDQYFMTMVYVVSLKSKDESTKFGAVITTLDNSLVSTGYNSFPRGLNDNIAERQQRPGKYFYFEHAERNSVVSAAKIGTHTNGCKMYTQGMPCADCGRVIIQAGITDIYLHAEWGEISKSIFGSWQDSQLAARTMFQECGVNITFWNGKISNDQIQIKTCIRGEWFEI